MHDTEGRKSLFRFIPTALALLLLGGCVFPGSAPVSGSLGVRYKDEVEMVYISAGEFLMGDTNSGGDESPRHRLRLEGFWIDKTEVTNGQYSRCVQAGACRPPARSRSHNREQYYGNPEYEGYPVIYVSWHDAVAYCSWAGGRIPSEAEWEKAASGAVGREFPWGHQPDPTMLNSLERGPGDTSPVGDYQNGGSLYDVLNMSGNVREWTNSLYKTYPYSDGDGREEREGPGPRVLRGGSWGDGLAQARVAARAKLEPDVQDEYTGFRCASPLSLGMP